MLSTLRPHQISAMTMLREALRAGKRRPMLQAPTGFGKTILAAAIVDGAQAKGNRVVFCVPALSLIDQTVKSFWKEGIQDVGVIQSGHELTNPNRTIQVASVQTLQRRTLPLTDVVVIDEAHRWFKFYGEWMNDALYEKVPFIGLSATPWTRGLGKYFDDLLIAATTQDLINKEFLSRFRVFGPSSPDLTGVRTVAGDYHEGDLAEAMDKPQLTADVVSTWCKLGEGRPTLVFGVNRAHARSLQSEFEKAGVRAGYIDAYTTKEEREAVADRFHSGGLQVVCNVGCLTTGVDWDVRCIVLARPTKSEMLFTQIIGRGLRTAKGKDDCLILDHSDTHQRLGFVTDIHHETLCDGKPKKPRKDDREKSAPLPKVCPSCSFLKPVKVHTCPSCGFTPERQNDVEMLEGELVSLDGKKQKHSPEEKRRWYSELLGYATEQGKTSKFALANFYEKFGEWPYGKNSARPSAPSDEVRSYIRSRQIAYAKRRQKQKAGAAA
ncbi:DEAD/DEAH box helicase [Roseibium sp. RKSG952]|uniref:DEAD/DEAH box helicase n=1 Tax=Roseibium sp. RKSG952 TaxID=2529384 RepID=UPI0012BD0651|nr:DEAD/DEAH box helicase [Roseibium sp. RKSG952]MTH96561.1 DEAD/DEAH box helicase [Roseibium sp. RKSG952]